MVANTAYSAYQLVPVRLNGLTLLCLKANRLMHCATYTNQIDMP